MATSHLAGLNEHKPEQVAAPEQPSTLGLGQPAQAPAPTPVAKVQPSAPAPTSILSGLRGAVESAKPSTTSSRLSDAIGAKQTQTKQTELQGLSQQTGISSVAGVGGSRPSNALTGLDRGGVAGGPPSVDTSAISVGETPMTVEDSTKIIDELDTAPIESAGRTAGEMQDEIFTRQKEIFLRDKIRQDQFQNDRYKQQLSQSGFANPGSRDALLLMLQTSQANQTTGVIENMQLKQLENAVGERKVNDANMINLFNDQVANGDLESATILAQQLAASDPDNAMWAYIAANPDAIARTYDPAVQARRRENRANANEVIANLDFENDAAVQNGFGGWKDQFWMSEEDLRDDRITGWDAIPPEELRETYRDMFGKEISGNLSEAEANEVYAKHQYNKKIQNLEEGMVGENLAEELLKSGQTVDEQTLEDLQEFSGLLFSQPSLANGFDIEGMTFNTGDINSDKMAYLFQDWEGTDYDPETNSRADRSQWDKNMDVMWRRYLENIGDEIPVTRNAFKEAMKLDAHDGALGNRAIIEQINGFKEDTGITEVDEKFIDAGLSNKMTRKEFDALNQLEVKDLLAKGMTPKDLVDRGMVKQMFQGKSQINIVNSTETHRKTGLPTVKNGNGNWGALAIENETIPRYVILDDGLLYQTSEAVESKGQWVVDLTPMEPGGQSYSYSTRRTETLEPRESGSVFSGLTSGFKSIL